MKGIKKLKQTIQILISNFFEHNVGRNSAAIAYYLVFALFPFLIFISNLLGLLNLDIESISNNLLFVLPKDIVRIIEEYLMYVTQISSRSIFIFSLFFSVYFPMRVSRGLMDSVRLAYHLNKPKHSFLYVFRQIRYTIILFLSLSLTLFLLIMGRNFLDYISNLDFIKNSIKISQFLFVLWDYVRFIIVGGIMFWALGMLYIMAQDEKIKIVEILPGAVISLVLWLLVSMVFSNYVENFSKYSVIYGALGGVIVLLIWLYLSSAILILGGEINAVSIIDKFNRKKKQ